MRWMVLNKDDRNTLLQNLFERKPTEEELKEYKELEKEFLGDPVKKTGIYAEKEEKIIWQLKRK